MADHFAEDLEFLAAENICGTRRVCDTEWLSNDSSFEDYSTYSLLPPGLLPKILDRQLTPHSHNVGVDLAGGEDGRALQDLLARGVIHKALLTTYTDRRSAITKKMSEIDHIAGDLISRDTWRNIIEWRKSQAPNGFSLVMHRPLGALQDLQPVTYVGATNLLLDMIRPGGVLFSEIPGGLYGPGMPMMRNSLRARADIDDVIVGDDRLFTSAVIIKSEQAIEI